MPSQCLVNAWSMSQALTRYWPGVDGGHHVQHAGALSLSVLCACWAGPCAVYISVLCGQDLAQYAMGMPWGCHGDAMGRTLRSIVCPYHTVGRTLRSIDESLARTGLEYIDVVRGPGQGRAQGSQGGSQGSARRQHLLSPIIAHARKSSPMLPPAPHASPPMPGLPPHAPMHLPLHIPGPDPRPRVAYIWRGGLC